MTLPDGAYDPFDPNVHEDPYPIYAKLRDQAPAYWAGRGHQVLRELSDVRRPNWNRRHSRRSLVVLLGLHDVMLLAATTKAVASRRATYTKFLTDPPTQPTPRELRSGLGRLGGVLAPHMTTAAAPVAAHGHFKCRGTPAQWFVREASDHGVAWGSLASAAAAPSLVGAVGLHDATGQDSTIWFESLASGFEAELVESAEHGQIRAGEARPRGGVRHVEVFRMGGVGTSIFGRPRPLPGRRPQPPTTSHARYTLTC